MSPSALQLVPDTVDLVERVREWLIPFQLVARESGERLLLSMPETDIPVTIDTERFAWVLSNLVSNALRVGSVGSTVRIVITQEEARCRSSGRRRWAGDSAGAGGAFVRAVLARTDSWDA